MSTNISKLHREGLLQKIQQIRTYIESAPLDANTKNLLSYLEELTKDVKGKKYGLVFEEHREEIDEKLEKNEPVLIEQKELFIDNGGEMNFLIEGDNLAALKLLEKTHKNKVDVIYIDPPYNTGNEDFIYDDAGFVSKDDKYIHSKWLSFMSRRLQLSKKLLSEYGSIFISIDDNENATLKILCDEIFGENNFINQISIKSKVSSGASGGGEDKKLKKNTEYILWYVKNRDIFTFNLLKEKKKLVEYIQEHKENSIGFYYTRILKDFGVKKFLGSIKAGNGENIDIYEHENFAFSSIANVVKKENLLESEVYKKYCDQIFMVTNAQTSILPKVNTFVGGKGKLISYEYVPTTGKKKGTKEIKYVWNNTLVVWLKDSVIKEKNELYKTVSLGTLWDTISWGRLDLEGAIKFKNGKKPTSLVCRLIELATKKDSIILDFFAGSGTTGHAVLKYNQKNICKHKFILCNSNENNICQNITYERLKTVITGKRKDGSEYGEKYDASLKYYKIDFIPIEEKFYYEYADELLKHVRELVELENGINFTGNQEVAIVLTDEEMDVFVAQNSNQTKILYRGHNVLLKQEHIDFIKQHNIKENIIPDYYYNGEN